MLFLHRQRTSHSLRRIAACCHGSPIPVAPSGQGLATGPLCRTRRYNPPAGASLQRIHLAAWPMTSEQAAQLIDDTLDLVHEV